MPPCQVFICKLRALSANGSLYFYPHSLTIAYHIGHKLEITTNHRSPYIQLACVIQNYLPYVLHDVAVNNTAGRCIMVVQSISTVYKSPRNKCLNISASPAIIGPCRCSETLVGKGIIL